MEFVYSEWVTNYKALLQKLKVARDVASTEGSRVNKIKLDWLRSNGWMRGCDWEDVDFASDLVAHMDRCNQEDGYGLEPGQCPAQLAELYMREIELQVMESCAVAFRHIRRVSAVLPMDSATDDAVDRMRRRKDNLEKIIHLRSGTHGKVWH